MGASAITPSARLQASSFTAPPARLVHFWGPLVLPLEHRLRATAHRDNDFVQLRIGAFSVSFSCMVLFVASLRLPSLLPQSLLLWLLVCFVLLVLGELVITPLGFALMTGVVAPQHVGLVSALWYDAMAADCVLAGEFGSLLQQKT